MIDHFCVLYRFLRRHVEDEVDYAGSITIQKYDYASSWLAIIRILLHGESATRRFYARICSRRSCPVPMVHLDRKGVASPRIGLPWIRQVPSIHPFDTADWAGGFVALWALNYVTLIAGGFAMETVLAIVGVSWLPFFLILWIIRECLYLYQSWFFR